MATTDQKLKVIQTWIFIQAVLLALLTAYVVVLGVWLAPFFPMNYDDTAEDGSTITLASLQRDYMTLSEDVFGGNGSLGYLHLWRERHQMEHVILNKKFHSIEFQLSKIQSLEEAQRRMENEIHYLLRKNEVLNKEVGGLKSRVEDLQKKCRRTELRSFVDFTDCDRRIRQLECEKDSMENIVRHFVTSTEEKFCVVSKQVGNAVDLINQLQDRVTTVTPLTVGQLQHDMDDLKALTSGMRAVLYRNIESQIANDKWTRNKFIEQDDLRGTALEKQRTLIYTQIGKLECAFDDYAFHISSALRGLDERISSLTPDAFNILKRNAEETNHVFEDKFSKLMVNLSEEIEDAKQNIEQRLSEMNGSFIDEMRDHAIQFVKVCDMIREESSSGIDHYKELKWGIVNLDVSQTELKQRVSSLEDIATATIDNTIKMQELQWEKSFSISQFHEETIQTELDLLNRVCILESMAQKQ